MTHQAKFGNGKRALVLVGHGSSRNPGTRLPVCANVKRIKADGRYDEVYCGLWQEDPHMSVTLDRVEADDITVVPFFISDGYYTQQVIPREMRLDGPMTQRDGKLIRYTQPIGEHPSLAPLIIQRAQEAGATPEACLAVLGHGTPRNPNSAANVYRQAERVAKLNEFKDVVTVFLDQEPNMLDVWSMTECPEIFMVPLFIGDGWHVTESIPEELGLEDGMLGKDGRKLTYAAAVGTAPSLFDVIMELADDAATWPIPTG